MKYLSLSNVPEYSKSHRVRYQLILSIIFISICVECEDNKHNISDILNGYWETKLNVLHLNSSNLTWQEMDSLFVERNCITYRYWQIDADARYINQADGCDFETYIQVQLEIISNRKWEFMIGGNSFEITDWSSDNCILQGFINDGEQYIYSLTRMKDDYSSPDYRDIYIGDYKGNRRNWTRGPGDIVSEFYDYDYVVNVTKLSCSPDQIRISEKGAFSLSKDFRFGYNHMPDRDMYSGQFSNDTILVITFRALGGDIGSSFSGVRIR